MADTGYDINRVLNFTQEICHEYLTMPLSTTVLPVVVALSEVVALLRSLSDV